MAKELNKYVCNICGAYFYTHKDIQFKILFCPCCEGNNLIKEF